MNNLFSCSWVKNTNILVENHIALNEAKTIAANIAGPSIKLATKLKKQGLVGGTPYRDVWISLIATFLKNDPEISKYIPPSVKNKLGLGVAPLMSATKVSEIVNKLLSGESLVDKDNPSPADAGIEVPVAEPMKLYKTMMTRLEEYGSAKVTDPVTGREMTNLEKFLLQLKKVNDMQGGVVTIEDPEPIDIEDEIPGPEGKPKGDKLGGLQGAIKRIEKGESFEFQEGEDDYDTLIKNLDPDTSLEFVQPVDKQSDLYKVEIGDYEFMVVLRGTKGKDIVVSDLNPDSIEALNVFDTGKKDRFEAPSVKMFKTPRGGTFADVVGYYGERPDLPEDYPADEGELKGDHPLMKGGTAQSRPKMVYTTKSSPAMDDKPHWNKINKTLKDVEDEAFFSDEGPSRSEGMYQKPMGPATWKPEHAKSKLTVRKAGEQETEPGEEAWSPMSKSVLPPKKSWREFELAGSKKQEPSSFDKDDPLSDEPEKFDPRIAEFGDEFDPNMKYSIDPEDDIDYPEDEESDVLSKRIDKSRLTDTPVAKGGHTVNSPDSDCEMTIDDGGVHVKNPSDDMVHRVAHSRHEINKRMEEERRRKLQGRFATEQKYRLGY